MRLKFRLRILGLVRLDWVRCRQVGSERLGRWICVPAYDIPNSQKPNAHRLS